MIVPLLFLGLALTGRAIGCLSCLSFVEGDGLGSDRILHFPMVKKSSLDFALQMLPTVINSDAIRLTRARARQTRGSNEFARKD